jgi:hypothetical protein
MSEKRPQPTAVIVKRLKRVAKYLQGVADAMEHPADAARANTCWQAVARLELLTDESTPRCESCSLKATTEDDNGVPLCDACYAGLEREA